MPTDYGHRVLIVIPVARRAAMITWWSANLDAGQGANAWNVGLNASGNPADAITHYWVSVALVPVDLGRLIARLCNLAGLPLPDWQNLTRAEQLAWLTTNLPVIRIATGIAVVRDDNDGDWSRAEDLLGALGLQRIGG
jgi:hypothetical protein